MSAKDPVILVCLFHWHQDQKQLEKVAKLVIDLLPEMTDAECMFVGRYDSPAASANIQIAARNKFSSVHVWRCDRKALGFPAGCNEMAYGVLNYIVIERHQNRGFRNIDAILFLEADCVILRPDWIKELKEEWKKTLDEGKVVCGPLQKAFKVGDWDIAEHINAVAMYDAEVIRHLPCLVGGPNQTGWDHYHGPSVVPKARNSPLFKLDYRKPTITEEELYSDPQVLVYHGVKDDSAIEIVRKRNKL